MRRRLGGVLAAVMLALAGLVVAAPAGAQTEVFSCSYEVGPTVLPPGGGFVTVQGTAPGTSVVRIFVDGELAAVTFSAPVTGFFSADVFLTGSAEITVALDDYPNTPCIGIGGSGTGRVTGRGFGTGTGIDGRLAGTGSSGTERVVLVGAAAIGLGAVLVVAARRRRRVAGRV